MRNLSEEFVEQQNKGNHDYQKFVDITLKDGTVLHLTNKHLWSNGFSFDDSVSSQDNFDIGSAIVNKFKIVINNIYDEFSNYVFTGSTAVVYVGLRLSNGVEKIRICTGILSDEPKQRSSIITLQFLDNMYKFDKDYSGVKTVFPATRNKIVRDICSYCGVTLQTVTFDNDSYVIQNRPDDEALTCRQMLSWVAQIGCQWAKCDEYGRLCFEWYNTKLTNEHMVQIKSTIGAPVVNIEDVVITGVRVAEYIENASEDNPAKSYLYGTEGYVLNITGNKLIIEGTGKTISSMIGEKCVGMRFRPFEASCLTDISIEAGDPVIITDRKGNVSNSFITNVSLRPGEFQSLSCGAKSAERNSAKQYSIITQAEVEARKNIQKEKTEREKALEELAVRLENSPGVFTTVETDTGGGKIYYLHNKPKLSDSDMVWKMTAEAWAVSTDGGKTWNAGMTVDGDTIVRILTSTGVNADWINAGAITVKDPNQNIIFSVDMDTKRVIISGDSVQIGGQTASQALEENKEIANQALKEAKKANNLTVILDNNFQGIPADYNGNITVFPTVKTRVSVFRGYSDISENCSYSIAKSDSVTGSWDNTKREYAVTGLSADTGWVDITASYMSLFTSTKRFSVAKIKGGTQGPDGAPGRTYFLEPSTLVLKKGQDNVISPGTVDFKAFYRDGNSASRTAYSGRFKIEETVDGTTWKTIYTSSANESSVKHSTYDYLTDAAGNVIITASGHGIVAAVRDIHMIRCTLYAAGGTTNALDTQSVTVVKDVKALTQEEVFNILTNNGAVKGIWMENGQLYISFTIAKGGEITLGGVNNGNGKLVILDSKGRQVGYIDNTGAHFNKGEFLGELKSGNDSTYIIVSDGNLSFYSYGKLVSQYGKGSNSSNVLYEKVYGSKSCNILRGATWFTTNEDNSYNSVRYDNGIRVGGGGKMRRDSLGKDVSADILCICTPPGNTYKELAGILFGDSTTAPRIYRSYSDRIEIAPGQSSGSGSLFCHGGFGCAGTKSRDVKTKDYSNRLLYCYEMPSPMFGDTGEAVTDESGTCYIYLDDIFAKTINSCMEYQVFLQKEGQGDLWVDLKESAYFVVKGTPGLKFSWEIKAKQRNYEYERLESTEVTRNDVEIIDYETQGQGLFEEYLLEKETAYEESN
nr:hypothetical protein [uncultured Blautia sp.]